MVLPGIPLTDSGTWQYMGENVRMISGIATVGKGGPIPIVYEVCVEGNRLQLDQSFFFQIGFTLER
jgi:hypothetical protein